RTGRGGGRAPPGAGGGGGRGRRRPPSGRRVDRRRAPRRRPAPGGGGRLRRCRRRRPRLGRRGRDRRGDRRRGRPSGGLRPARGGGAGSASRHGARPQPLDAPRLPDPGAFGHGGAHAGGGPRAARPGRRARSAPAGGGGGPPPRGVGRRGGVVSKAEETVLELDGRQVRITSPQKVFFPERGETKLDLVRYYEAVREPLMATMGGRPVLLQRFPEGAGGSSFFQKRVNPKDAPDWLQTTVVSTPNGTTTNALVAADVAHVAWAV